MVRSFWMGTPVAALALAAAAWGQSPWAPLPATPQTKTSTAGKAAMPAPVPPAQPGERLITVQELNRPGQQCRVVRSWVQADGSQAYQVQALDTGEIMTIVEGGAVAMPAAPGRPQVRSVATTIFHWGRSSSPPKGSPWPPRDVEMAHSSPWSAGASVVEPMQQGHSVSSQPLPAGTRVVEPKRPLLSRLLPWSRPQPQPALGVGPDQKNLAFEMTAQRMEPGDTRVTQQFPPGQTVTAVVEPRRPLRQRIQAARTAPPLGDEVVVSGQEFPVAEPLEPAQPGKVWTQPPSSPAPVKKPAVVRKPVPAGTVTAKAEKPTLLQRLFGKPKPKPGTPHRPAASQVASRKQEEDTQKVPARKKVEVKVAVEPARPTNPRESWGKVEPLDPPPSVKQAMERTVADSKRPKLPPKPEIDVAAVPLLPEEPLPHSRKAESDPLSDPSPYRKHTPEDRKKPSVARAPVPPPPAAPEPTKETTVSTNVPASRPADQLPPGSGSVLAAGAPRYLPVPIPTVPPPRPATPPAQPPQAPQLNRMVNSGPQGEPASGMANAFTEPGPTRPIPSETNSAEVAANAFSSQEQSGPPQGYPQAPLPPRPAMLNPALAANPSLASGYPVPPQAYGAGLPTMPEQPGAVAGVARIPVMPQYAPAVYYNYGMPNPMALPAPLMAQAGYAPPAQPVQSAAPTTAQTMQMMRESDFPSQREWAAEQLSDLNWRTNPQVVQALLVAAKDDPAATVRACCVRSLMKMQANTMPVVATIQALKSDTDPRVREAVGEALVSFGIPPAAPGQASIQPVGGPEAKEPR